MYIAVSSGIAGDIAVEIVEMEARIVGLDLPYHKQVTCFLQSKAGRRVIHTCQKGVILEIMFYSCEVFIMQKPNMKLTIGSTPPSIICLPSQVYVFFKEE